jgi:hypothetical protein
MDEDVLVASIGLNETKALLAVKPFYCSRGHGSSFFDKCIFKSTDDSAGKFEIFWRETLNQARCSRPRQVVRPNPNNV